MARRKTKSIYCQRRPAFEAPAADLTLDEFVELPDSDHVELVEGVPVGKEMAYRKRIIQNNVGYFLKNVQINMPLGHVAVEGLTRLDAANPRRGRRPDVAFIRFDRIGDRDINDAFLDVCPDLCFGVVAPNDTSFEVSSRIAEFLTAGAGLVWEVQPEARAVLIHLPDGTARHVRGDEVLSGEDVLPAFAVLVSRLFPLP